MNGPPLMPDDPKLTAYALGELSGDERAAVEAALREDPALRAQVEEIRVTAHQLEVALEGEPILGGAEAPVSIGRAGRTSGRAAPPRTAETGRVAHRPGSAPVTADRDHYRRAAGRGKLIRFPLSYFLIGGLAAACVACWWC